jgi:DhnA family fructose-bisphosphate aldolase class Ia
LINDSVNSILEELNNVEYGEHVIVIHPHLNAFRKMYSDYTKKQLVNNNGIVLLAPHYETIDAVKTNLGVTRHHSNSSNNDDTDLIGAPTPINNSDNLQKYEKDGSLLIVDSLKTHFHADLDIKSFIRKLVEHAKNTGKDGVSVFVDMGSFYHHNKIDELIEHELSIPSKYHDMKLRRFCIYHQKDFDRLKKEQKNSLHKHHSKEIVVIDK